MIIGLHATNEAIVTSEGDVIKEPPYLGWLVNYKPECTKIAYDIDAFTASLAHLIELTKLEATKLINNGKLYIAPYRMTYFPGRFMSIDEGYHEGHNFFNLANANQPQYFETHYSKDDSIIDAIAKAHQALEIGQQVERAYKRIRLNTNKLVSPIGAFLESYKLDLPTAEDMPDEVLNLAWFSAKGGLVETYSMGVFDSWDYDINSCYAYWLSKIPDFKRGMWVHSTEIPDEATHGFAKGILETTANFHPFIVKINEDNYTPTGSFPNIITLQEIRLMQRLKIAEFAIDDGWWWLPNKKKAQYYPYQGAVAYLWNMRQGTKGIDKSIITRIYSGLYGKSLQSMERKGEFSFGKEFCPVVGATIEANARLQVFETCYNAGIVPLAIMTDGFLTDKAIELKTNNELGGWKLSHQGKTIINSSNQIAFEGKEELSGELALHYDWLIDAINKKPKSKTYHKLKYSPITLAKALTTDFNKLGQIETSKRSVIVGEESKRVFLERPKNGSDLISGKKYDSLAWSYEIISKRGEL